MARVEQTNEQPNSDKSNSFTADAPWEILRGMRVDINILKS